MASGELGVQYMYWCEATGSGAVAECLGRAEHSVENVADDLDEWCLELSVEVVCLGESTESNGLEVLLAELARGRCALQSKVEDSASDVQDTRLELSVPRVDEGLLHLRDENVERDGNGLWHKVDALLERLVDEELLVLELAALQDRGEEGTEECGMRQVGDHVHVPQRCIACVTAGRDDSSQASEQLQGVGKCRKPGTSSSNDKEEKEFKKLW